MRRKTIALLLALLLSLIAFLWLRLPGLSLFRSDKQGSHLEIFTKAKMPLKLMEERLRAVEAYPESDKQPQLLAKHVQNAHQAHVDKANVDEPQQAAMGGLSSNACKNAGVCTMGDVTEKTISWKLPPGKYEGAKCEAPLVCMFGPRHNDFVGKKMGFKDVPDSQTCPTYPTPTEINLLPEWVIAARGNRSLHNEIEEKLSIQDKCVEKWRAQNARGQHPCRRCHGIANTPVISKIYAELIARLPRCQRICETGFNRGDSSIVLTVACGHGAQGLSFSLNTRWYTQPGMACQDEALAHTRSTITVVEGFSTTSIADFISRNSESKDHCDVIMVDGIKSARGRYQDLADLAPLAHKNTLWITDDVELPGAHQQKPKHCIHKVFFAFAKQQGFDVKCQPTGSGDYMGQCYGYSDWDALLAGGVPR